MSGTQFDLFGTPPPPVPPDKVVLDGTDATPPDLPDAAARARIHEDLDTNLLVEAGAGAGKTTAMVGRMVALVRSGRAEVEQIAAVTFTRKAAAELRERFQTSLEKALHATDDPADAAVRTRLDRALRDIDRAFLGTIHAFCARLLRERPLEAGLDPGFRETLGSEESRQRRRFWLTHLERLSADGDASLVELAEIGLRPQQLFALFEQSVGQPDVTFEATVGPRPEAAFIRRRIEAVMDRAQSHLPVEEPAKGWDALQATLRKLRFHRFVLNWQRDSLFLDAIGALRPASFKVVQNRWPDGGAAKALSEELCELFADGSAADRLLHEWWAFRYPYALGFARRAAVAYEHDRLRAGTLNFHDLLQFAARLLRESPAARRELGERYRYLLVDEFQDTDPVQAEVVFLLASDPDSGTEWRAVVPRPGALFVVGDPKQSIYRFRRADMTLYTQVKQRFEQLGAVLELVANFRSGIPVERFVNETFGARFPEHASATQAPFAPMRVQPRREPAVEGVFWYELDDPVNSKVDQLAAQDASRLATWIAERVATGERAPGDFLVLTPTTRRLSEYAAALEQRNIPVQVTGAGVGEAVHLRELRLLLRALADPGDPALAVAVLVGLFFGLDYERLAEHVERCSPEPDEPRSDPFSFTHAWKEENDVARALDTLHRFWRWTREEPADIAVERMVEEIGLLPLAAAGDLGQTRAGAVLFALDAVRAAALAGDSSIAGALAALDAALDEDESEAPLEPGRSDVVRVMNLHKAKGLESPVVILAHPMGDWRPEPMCRVERDETGRARGFTKVHERRGSREQPVTLAQPIDWEAHAAREVEFERAERERLLYVAATRAGDELVIAVAENRFSPSPWRSFQPWLQAHGTRIVLPQAERSARHPLETEAAAIVAAIEATSAERERAGVPGYRAAPVTVRKVEAAAFAPAVSAELPADAVTLADRHERGTEWGTIVHEALEAALRGADGDRLAALGRGWLLAAERPTDAEGEPLELAELLELVAAVRASPLWQRALASPLRLSEVPFAVPFSAAEYRALTGTGTDAAPLEIVDGRIDLAFREGDGWTVVDYKSDADGARIPATLLSRYAAQVRLYGIIWERVTGEPVREKVLLFTADGAVMPV